MPAAGTGATLPPTVQMMREQRQPVGNFEGALASGAMLPPTEQMMRPSAANAHPLPVPESMRPPDSMRVPDGLPVHLGPPDSMRVPLQDGLPVPLAPKVEHPAHLGSLPPELLIVEGIVGWHGDSQGRPIKVGKEAWALLAPTPRYTAEDYPMRSTWIRRRGRNGGAWEQVEDHTHWAGMTDPHGLLKPPADGIIVRFEKP